MHLFMLFTDEDKAVCHLILFCIQSNINNPIKTGEGLDLGG
jgi:hypothetical protein